MMVKTPHKPPRDFLLRSRSGFTLVEVLVAIVILSVGLVTVVETMGRTQHALRISRNLLIASQAAENEFVRREMEVRQYDKLKTGSSSETIKLPGKQFAVTSLAAAYQDETILDQSFINRVDIQVDWNDGRARQNEMKVTSILTNRKDLEELGQSED